MEVFQSREVKEEEGSYEGSKTRVPRRNKARGETSPVQAATCATDAAHRMNIFNCELAPCNNRPLLPVSACSAICQPQRGARELLASPATPLFRPIDHQAETQQYHRSQPQPKVLLDES